MEEEVVIKDENGKEILGNKRLVLALLSAFCGSLIGFGIWVGLAALDFYASIAALSVAYFAKLFYDLAKGPQTKAKFYGILIITIVMLLVSEYVSLYMQLVNINNHLEAGNKIVDLTFLNTLPVVFRYAQAFIFDFIIFIAFSILGSFSILRQTYLEVTGKRKTKIKATNFNQKDNEDFEANFKEFENNSKDKFDDKFDDSTFNK